MSLTTGAPDITNPTDDMWSDSRAWVDPDAEPSSTHALFDGDDGDLSLGQRKALVVLMKNRFITSQSHPEEWRAVLADEATMRSTLHNMFLDLKLDREREVAYKVQVTPEASVRFPTLLHATEWTREETILLVHLRTVAHAAHAAGDSRVFVDRADLMDHVASIRPESATDQVRDGGKTRKAIESLVSAGLLVGRKDDDRFEIASAVDVLLPLELLQGLLVAIRADGADPQPPGDSEPEDTNQDGVVR